MSLQDHILNQLAMAIDDCVSISGMLIDDSKKSSALATSIEERDFSKLKNKFQAIGIVLKEFGELTDGNVVKKVIENL